MKHFIVNIGCEYGSGGPDIGKMVAESLGIPFYDRDLVDQVVEKLGVDRDLVEKADSGEENVKYEFDTTFGPRYANLTNRVIYTQFEVIHKLAAKSSCVIIGRCSNYILKDRDDCLNIFVYAPEEYKVKHIMEQKGVSQKEAQKLVKYNDGMLKSRYEYMTSSDMRDCRTRHMMIDSSILGLEKTAKYIMQLIDLRFEIKIKYIYILTKALRDKDLLAPFFFRNFKQNVKQERNDI